jgi:hypothetical protein
MAKPCNCKDKRPEGAPEDSIRNAAAMWMASGKNAGFVEGVEFVILHLRRCAPALVALVVKLELPKKKGDRMAKALQQLEAQLRQAVAEKAKEAASLNKMATLMADRLESASPASSRGARQRLRDAFAALKA